MPFKVNDHNIRDQKIWWLGRRSPKKHEIQTLRFLQYAIEAFIMQCIVALLLRAIHSIEPACKISDAIISQLDFLGCFQKRKLTDAVFPPKRPSRSSVQRCPCVISRYNILNHSAVLNVKVALVYWIDLFVARCDRLVRRLEVSRLILSDKWGN